MWPIGRWHGVAHNRPSVLENSLHTWEDEAISAYSNDLFDMKFVILFFFRWQIQTFHAGPVSALTSQKAFSSCFFLLTPRQVLSRGCSQYRQMTELVIWPVFLFPSPSQSDRHDSLYNSHEYWCRGWQLSSSDMCTGHLITRLAHPSSIRTRQRLPDQI